MKKVLLTSCFIAFFAILGTSQINPHAIGLRFGAGYFSGVEISYQHGLGGVNRFEADLGWNSSRYFRAFKISGNYQWVYPTNWTENLNWFVGPGAYLGSASYRTKYLHPVLYPDRDENYFFLGLNGMLGLEYNFPDIPINVSVDIRPQLEIIGDGGNFGFESALGIRYYW